MQSLSSRSSAASALRAQATRARAGGSRCALRVAAATHRASDARLPVAAVAIGALSATVPPAARAESVREAAERLQAALDTANSVLEQAGQAAGVAAEVAKSAIETVKPVVDKAAPVVAEAANETVKVATPLVKQGISSVASTLQQSGVDVDGAVKTASKAFATAAPVVSEAASVASDVVTKADPGTIATAGSVGVALVVLSPVLLPLLAGALRGYAGDLTPAKTIDLLTQTDATLVDVRTAAQVEARGVPGLPRGASGKLVRVEVEAIADRALRAAMRDPGAVEAQSTALIISQLKRVSRGKPVVILDANHGVAKTVARKLAALGFGRVYTVQGGFEGRGGWVQSGLATTEADVISGRSAGTLPRGGLLPGGGGLPKLLK